MELQERDEELMLKIQECGGMLARRQIKPMFWRDKTKRAMEQRLKKLHDNGYLTGPSKKQKHKVPEGESIVLLAWRGVYWIAGQWGLAVEPPYKNNENQYRLFEKRLRDLGIPWLQEPNWNQISHDLAVVDFQLAVEKAARKTPLLTFKEWINEREFRVQRDVVEYEFNGSDRRIHTAKKGVIPDGYFVIYIEKLKRKGKPAHIALLLELDMATHDNKSFGQEKAAAGLAYIHSQAYKNRFGHNSGRWLIVTTGKQRMENLMKQTQQTIEQGAGAFLFTTLDQVKNGKLNVLFSPIWRKVGKTEPIALFV